jgi:plastocyanin
MGQVRGLMKERRRRGSAVGLLVVAALVAAGSGCSGSAASSTTGTSDPSGTLAPVQSGNVTISARDNSFVPESVTVTVGSELVWHNDGRNDHNIVAVGDTPFHVDTGDFKPKATYQYAATKPGTYHYYCSIHGTPDKGMVGTVQVVPN